MAVSKTHPVTDLHNLSKTLRALVPGTMKTLTEQYKVNTVKKLEKKIGAFKQGTIKMKRPEKPRRALNAHRRRQEEEEDRENDRETGQVAPAAARVGEEEGDGREHDTHGHGNLQTQTKDIAKVRRRQLVDVRAQCARSDTGSNTRYDAAHGKRPDVGNGGLDYSTDHNEGAVHEQQLLASPHIAEVAAEQRADHTAEDPRVDGERPLQLRVAREHEARAVHNGARIALVGVVVLRQVRLRGGPTALKRLEQSDQDAAVEDPVGLDAALRFLVGLVIGGRDGGLGRGDLRVHLAGKMENEENWCAGDALGLKVIAGGASPVSVVVVSPRSTIAKAT
ncbi:hypothetical protein ON010_g1823 [Phytophthora cinnamomi]|nr:hypothetical protein ON010_g1823 [Phytophthora cinnamomi]